MIGYDFVGLVLDWRTWVAMAVLVMFPGLLLRLFLLIYPRRDPRRQELLAEMYAVPVVRRPLWVFAQIEVIVWEGLPERWYQFAVGRIIYRWKLMNGERLNRDHPESFWLPPKEDRVGVQAGDFVKLIFSIRDGSGERMWVRVEKRKRRKFVGTLANDPVLMFLEHGDRVSFTSAQIIDIDVADDGFLCAGCEEAGGWSEINHGENEPLTFDDETCDRCGGSLHPAPGEDG